MGRKMGVKIRQAGVMSMKVPMINSRILMINRITYLLSLIPSMASDTALGMPVNAITQLMMLDTPIRKMICAFEAFVLSMPSVSMAIHNKEKTMKFKTAAAAALAVVFVTTVVGQILSYCACCFVSTFR